MEGRACWLLSGWVKEAMLGEKNLPTVDWRLLLRAYALVLYSYHWFNCVQGSQFSFRDICRVHPFYIRATQRKATRFIFATCLTKPLYIRAKQKPKHNQRTRTSSAIEAATPYGSKAVIPTYRLTPQGSLNTAVSPVFLLVFCIFFLLAQV